MKSSKTKKGKAITGLRREDFTVLENGVAQKIEFFDSTLTSEAGQPANPIVSTQPKSRTQPAFRENHCAGESSNKGNEAEGLVRHRPLSSDLWGPIQAPRLFLNAGAQLDNREQVAIGVGFVFPGLGNTL